MKNFSQTSKQGQKTYQGQTGFTYGTQKKSFRTPTNSSLFANAKKENYVITTHNFQRLTHSATHNCVTNTGCFVS